MAAVGGGLHTVLSIPIKSCRIRPIVESSPVWAHINPGENYTGCRALMVKYPGLPFLFPEIRELQVSNFDPAQLLKTFRFVQFFRKRHEEEVSGKAERWYENICRLLYNDIGCPDRC